MTRSVPIALALLLVWCTAVSARPLFLISTENGPDHVQTRIVQRFAERARACCGDRVEVDHRYGGALYRDRDVLPALASGKVAMALPGTWQLDTWAPEVGAFMLPIFYGRTEDEVARIEDGPAIEALNGPIEEALDAVVLGRWIGLGFSHTFLTDRAISDALDVAGLRVRLPGGAVNAWRLATLGAEPILIAWTDLPRALSERRIDALVSTFATLDSIDVWGRSIRFVLEDRQMYTQYVPLVGTAAWSLLDPDTRRDLRAAWETGVGEARALTAGHQEEARRRALGAGVRIATPPPERAAEVRRLLLARQPEIVKRVGIDPQAIDRIATGLEP